MNCPECGTKTEIHETRIKGGMVERRRYCCQCHAKFLTNETFARVVKRYAARPKAVKVDSLAAVMGTWNR